MNMQEKLEQAERLLNEVKEEMAKTSEVKPWPQDGDEYWVPNFNGSVRVYNFNGCEVDTIYFELGLAFKTKEEAEAEVEARKVIYELKQQPGVVKFTPSDLNWTIEVNVLNKYILPVRWSQGCPLQCSLWFESEEAVKAAITAVGKDRILKAARWWAMGEV